MLFLNGNKESKSPDAVLVLLFGFVLILLGMATGLTFFGFAGLGILIISVILMQRDGIHKPSLSFTKHINKNGKFVQENKNTEKIKTSYKERNKQRKKKQRSLTEEEATLTAEYIKLSKSCEKDTDLEQLLKELEGFDFSEEITDTSKNTSLEINPNKDEEHREEMRVLSEKIKAIRQKKELLQKEDEQDFKESLVEDVTHEKMEQFPTGLNSMDIFSGKNSRRYQLISLDVKGKHIQLLEDSELEKLEGKKRFKRYLDTSFKRYCDSSVYYNDIFVRVGERVLPISMIDGVYLYRDTIRMSLCNGKTFAMLLNCNKPETLQQISSDFAQNVLRMPLLDKNKIKELNNYSQNRYRQMLKEYNTGQMQPLDYILGDKLI